MGALQNDSNSSRDTGETRQNVVDQGAKRSSCLVLSNKGRILKTSDNFPGDTDTATAISKIIWNVLKKTKVLLWDNSNHDSTITSVVHQGGPLAAAGQAASNCVNQRSNIITAAKVEYLKRITIAFGSRHYVVTGRDNELHVYLKSESSNALGSGSNYSVVASHLNAIDNRITKRVGIVNDVTRSTEEIPCVSSGS